MVKPLQGRVALVTGASRGIGRAIAVRLAAMGASVAVNYRRDEAGARETLRLVREAGADGAIVQADISNLEAVEEMGRRVEELLGTPTVVVQNAGLGLAAPFHATDERLWRKMIDVNLTGAYNVARVFTEGMVREGWGRLVFVSSLAGLMGLEPLSAYSAAKAGVIGLARSLAIELGRHGVTVNVVAPGFVETDMAESYFRLLSSILGFDVKKRFLEERTLTGSLVRPEEVAEVVALLANPSVANLTGQVIIVDSGSSIALGKLPL